MTVKVFVLISRLSTFNGNLIYPTSRFFGYPIFSVQKCLHSSFLKCHQLQQQKQHLCRPVPHYHGSCISNCYISSGPKLNAAKNWLNKSTKKVYDWLEVLSPPARQFTEDLAKGAKENWSDVKTYWFVRKRLKVNPNASVSYFEEMKIFMLKREAVKIIPLIPFFVFPFGFITLFFPIYFFPRYVLPHTFWTDIQRKKFHSQMHQERLPHYNIVLHHLNYHRENTSNPDVSHLLNEIFTIMNANDIPSNALMLRFRSVCNSNSSPFNLEVRNVGILLRSFSRISLYYPIPLPTRVLCSQLQSYGKTIIGLDQKLRNGNALQKLSAKDVEIAALLRGVNSANLTTEANIYWLRNWLKLTKSCNSNDYWFVLHAMVLLSSNYNQLKFQRGVFG